MGRVRKEIRGKREIQRITLSAGELSSSEARMSCVATSGFHCRTEHLLLTESEKLSMEQIILVTLHKFKLSFYLTVVYKHN